MPELPEVETVKNDLKEMVIGETIIDVKIFCNRILQNVTDDDFINHLKGQKFVDIKRKGKYLIFIFSDVILLSHLRMEGKYSLKGNEEKTKHEHIIFFLKSGKTLRYNDTRKFGTMYLFNTNDLNVVLKQKPLISLGKEPFDEGFDGKYLQEKFKRIGKPIKSVLLDQTIISGLGNIYANEVCFMARINPMQPANSLTLEELNNIAVVSQKVLTKAITLGGTTIRSFVSAHEMSGKFQNELMVHTKTICPICHKEITKTFINGRGTYYCQNCQKMR
ncbi:MAG: DNA-formamidopyrimidine glycosylase [Bacilli bacterium]|nr:DNA-formamidopyrimidine glycosylase [Bacilli bacterium]